MPLTLNKIFHFQLTKIIIGSLVLIGSVALGELLRNTILDKTQLPHVIKNGIIGIIEIFLALLSYILLFRFYEKRKINELSLVPFKGNAIIGFSSGMIIQSLVILVLLIIGDYEIIHVNPLSCLVPGFIVAIIAGFVAEILLRGIIFRLIEEKLGTSISLVIILLLFVLMHIGSDGATILSVLSIASQAGFLISVLFVLSRSLWVPIFFHFAWDFAEPAIYGGINPGIKVETSLITSKISGSEMLTGGQSGPGCSVQAIIFCLIAGFVFLWLAKRKNNFIKPYWKRKT